MQTLGILIYSEYINEDFFNEKIHFCNIHTRVKEYFATYGLGKHYYLGYIRSKGICGSYLHKKHI